MSGEPVIIPLDEEDRGLHAASGGNEEPEKKPSRREFLEKGISAVGWGAFFACAAGGTYQAVRFFFPTVVFHPPSVFQIGRVEDFLSTEQPDVHGVILVESRFKQENRFYVVREPGRIYALYARCTHLGCTVNWFPNLRIFKCPCHGSEFHSNGKEFAGPAPRPLDRLKISVDTEGNLLVDTRVVYSALEFETKKAFIEVG
jgi:cytochrome b6-f complex iron-sulfur subunit